MGLGHKASSNTVARAFVDAREGGRALATYPGPMPSTLTEAYAIQDAALRLAGGTVAGWKVGRINPAIDEIDRLAGPIFADQVVRLADGEAAMPVFEGGFAAAEAEFLLRVGRAPDVTKTRYTMAEARSLIDGVHAGIEIASSPFAGINSHGPMVTVSDFGNNNGLVVGAELDGWADHEITSWPVQLLINDEPVGSATAATMLDGPFGAARYLFEHLAARGIAMPAGSWISSGAVTGVHPVTIGDRVRASFDHRFKVDCTISAR